MLNVLSERGQQTVADAQRAVDLFLRTYPDHAFFFTAQETDAAVDGVLLRGPRISALVEIKCRYDCDSTTFSTKYGNRWLVTYDKIERGRQLAQSLSTRLVGFLYLVQSDLLMVKAITDTAGKFVAPFSVAATETKANCEGGRAVRNNAYIDMSGATVLSGA